MHDVVVVRNGRGVAVATAEWLVEGYTVGLPAVCTTIAASHAAFSAIGEQWERSACPRASTGCGLVGSRGGV